MNTRKSIRSVTGLVLLATMLSACGGGGGGGGDDGLVYTGKTTKAKIRGGNAPELTGGVVGIYSTFDNLDIGPRSVQTELSPPTNFLQVAMQRIAGIGNTRVTNAVMAMTAARLGYRDVEFDESEDCEQGSLRIFGVIDDVDGTGELTFEFNDCREGGARIDGSFVAQVDAFDFGIPLPTRLRLSFDNLRIRDAGFDFSIGGTARFAFDTGNVEQKITLVDMVFADNSSNRMLRIVDLVSVYRFNSLLFPTQLTIHIRKGRVFNSRYGYVDVRSTVVITFSNLSQDFPNAGTYELTAEGSILATALNSTTVRIQADTDDNLANGYEFDRMLNWSDLDL